MFKNRNKSENSSSSQNDIVHRYESCIKEKIKDKNEQSWIMLNKVIPTNMEDIFKMFWNKQEELSDDSIKSNIEKWHTEYLDLFSQQKATEEAWGKYLIKFKKMNKEQQACEIDYFKENLAARFSKDLDRQKEMIHELEIIQLSDK